MAQFDPPAEPGDPRVGKALELWNLPEESGERITARLRSASDAAGRFKLVDRDGSEQLFDLDADPLELDPLDPAAAATPLPPADLERLRAALAAAEGPAAGEGPPSPRTADGVPPPSGEISDEERAKLEERMKLLGYL